MLRERAGVVPGDGRHDVARPVARQLGAEHDRAARQVAAQPAGAAHDLVRVEVLAGAQVLQEGAAQVLLDLLLGLLDGDLGQAGDRRQVEELRRVRGRRRVAAQQQHGAHGLVARGDRHLRGDAGGHLGRPVLDAVADVAAQRVHDVLRHRVGRRPPAPTTAAAPRRGSDDGDRRAHRVGGQGGHPGEPVAAQDGVEHRQVHLPQPRHEGRRAAGGGRRPAGGRRLVEAARRGGACVVRSRRPEHPSSSRGRPQAVAVAASGCAWSTSSPDSPVRTR